MTHAQHLLRNKAVQQKSRNKSLVCHQPYATDRRQQLYQENCECQSKLKPQLRKTEEKTKRYDMKKPSIITENTQDQAKWRE